MIAFAEHCWLVTRLLEVSIFILCYCTNCCAHLLNHVKSMQHKCMGLALCHAHIHIQPFFPGYFMYTFSFKLDAQNSISIKFKLVHLELLAMCMAAFIVFVYCKMIFTDVWYNGIWSFLPHETKCNVTMAICDRILENQLSWHIWCLKYTKGNK